jgi:hypothetical protein
LCLDLDQSASAERLPRWVGAQRNARRREAGGRSEIRSDRQGQRFRIRRAT